MARPRLSICIPTFKRDTLLRETLTHLREVCDDDVEIVISDNCSPDGTQDVIKSFAGRFRHFRSVRQTENRGATKNYAAAILLARGKYLYTLCDDDQIHIQGLQNAISIMEERPNIVAVYGGYEEWLRSTGETNPCRLVEQRMDFFRGDKQGVLNQFPLLWFPVCQTDIFHRYWSYDQRSFGFWELVGSFLERGDISVIADIFYKHAHTEPRMEYELTENWYHDAYRAGYECFVGRTGEADPKELASFISTRVTPAYLQGLRFAKIKGDFLAARHFILRARAYGLASAAMVMAWEKEALVGMVAERLLAKVELISEIDEIAFEASPRLRALCKHFTAVASKYSIVEISEEKLRQQDLRPNQFLVTYNYGALESGASAQCDQRRSISVEDLIETCRVTDQPLAFDVAGAARLAEVISPPPNLNITAPPMTSAAPIVSQQPAPVATAPIVTKPTSEMAKSTSFIANKVGRNDPCLCGSGKKYKHCHGRGD